MRRGRNESSGTYVEECSVFTKECTVEDQIPRGERAMKEALADTNAVIDQLIIGKLTPRDSKIIAAGISRGGFLSLILAGERPTLVEGVVNFVGGWLGATDRLTDTQNKARMDDQKARLERAAKRFSGPSVWFYASRDPFYREGVPQELYKYWTDAGGKGDFVYIAEHTLQSGHVVAANPALWNKQVQALLSKIEAP
jgi:pimeloyl-ACP methyl ester carboxylesterase